MASLNEYKRKVYEELARESFLFIVNDDRLQDLVGEYAHDEEQWRRIEEKFAKEILQMVVKKLS